MNLSAEKTLRKWSCMMRDYNLDNQFKINNDRGELNSQMTYDFEFSERIFLDR